MGKYFIKVITEINKKTNNKIKVLANDIKFHDCENKLGSEKISKIIENQDYKKLTVNELKKLAEEKGLKKYKRLSKKKLVELLSSS